MRKANMSGGEIRFARTAFFAALISNYHTLKSFEPVKELCKNRSVIVFDTFIINYCCLNKNCIKENVSTLFTIKYCERIDNETVHSTSLLYIHTSLFLSTKSTLTVEQTFK